MIKRFIDIVFSLVMLICVSPLILLSALLVKLNDSGPMFYKAKRAGLGGKPFEMYKLRTMKVGTDSADRKITQAEDERITSVGKWLRKFKIDELPQFINVLLGDMSIVGPRPEDWEIVFNYYTTDQYKVLKTRPGIACPVDVKWYPDLTYHDPPPPHIRMQQWYINRHLPVQVSEGIEYVENQSLLLDLKVMVQTFFCIFWYSWNLPPKRSLPESQLSSLNLKKNSI
jgi:lipopolysaccharide/colanic/teichoic acid biosynthesis glycosyltransferase